MNIELASLLKAGGTAAVLVWGFLYLVGKIMDRNKPALEVIEGLNQSLIESIENLNQQIHELEQQNGALRGKLRLAQDQNHQLIKYIQHCTIIYPDTAFWWADKLKLVER